MSSVEQQGSSSGSGLAGPSDQRPLSDQEFQLLQRLLSDPFSFPISFKTWLVSYLEGSDLTVPISSVNGLTSILGIAGVGGGTLGILPAGIVLPYGGSAAPAGSLLCDGASYSRTSQARLFSVIGTTYGAADGSSFNVPDLRGRVPTGLGPNGSVVSLGQNEGLPLGNRSPRHTHRLPGDASGNVSSGGGSADGNIVLTDYGPNAHTVPEAGLPVDVPAYMVVNFIIVA